MKALQVLSERTTIKQADQVPACIIWGHGTVILHIPRNLLQHITVYEQRTGAPAQEAGVDSTHMYIHLTERYNDG